MIAVLGSLCPDTVMKQVFLFGAARLQAPLMHVMIFNIRICLGGRELRTTTALSSSTDDGSMGSFLPASTLWSLVVSKLRAFIGAIGRC